MSSEIPVTRASLLVRLKSGADQAAWDEFVAIYEPLVVRIATQKGLQAADASDMAQEVMARAAARIGEWEVNPARGTLRGWLSTVARNLIVDFIRQRIRQPAQLTDSVLATRQEIVEADELYTLEERRQIFRWAAAGARQQVSESTWQAFWMAAIENLPVADTAARLGISPGAVYIARSRMLARIRELAAQALQHSGHWKLATPGDAS